MRELIEAIEAGTEVRLLMRKAFPDGYVCAMTAYDGDMNAALALMAAVLPGWSWQIEDGFAAVWIGDPITVPTFRLIDAEADTPARALLLAILRAMEGGK